MPADRASSPFKAEINSENCSGCGLCVTTCPTGSLLLERKPESEQSYVPLSLTETYIKLGQARGKMGLRYLIELKIRK